MAIVLESVSAPEHPQPNNSASAKAFADNYAKLAGMPMRDVKTIVALGFVALETLLGPHDYSHDIPGLIQDATVYTRGLTSVPFDPMVGFAACVQSVVAQLAPVMSDDINALLLEGRALADLSEDELNRIIAYLLAHRIN